MTSFRTIKPFWSPVWAGVALGFVLLLTFMLTGHGVGATGATTRLTAWLGLQLAPAATASNSYLAPLVQGGHPLSSWITWQVVGVLLGAWLSALWSGRMRLQVDGAHTKGLQPRLALALGGGLLAGAGARISAGCTSGLGLSGAATLSLAGFVFLGTFFAVGLLANKWMGGVK